MSAWDWCLLSVGATLQCMVLAAMLQGGCRRYPFLFAYMVMTSLSTVVQGSTRHYFGPTSREFTSTYWAADVLGTLLLLLTIIHLIRLALEKHRWRGPVCWGLLLGVVLISLGSVLYVRVHPRGFSWSRWMTEVSRDYYFAAALLNAALWFTLVRLDRRDQQVYLVTSSLGLMLSGAAIAHAIRLTGHLIFFANFFLVATYLASLYVWRYAFRRSGAPVLGDGDQPCEAELSSIPPGGRVDR